MAVAPCYQAAARASKEERTGGRGARRKERMSVLRQSTTLEGEGKEKGRAEIERKKAATRRENGTKVGRKKGCKVSGARDI
jgi:hypothetical protein